MKLSKRTEYGLRAAIQLARLGVDRYVQSKELAESEDLPNKFLEAILLALRRGGFLESKVGSGGGYRLSRSPGDIRVGDLIRRLEGRLSVRDVNMQTDTTAAAGKLAVRLVNQKLTEATENVLDAMTLEELLEQVNRATAGQQMYYI